MYIFIVNPTSGSGKGKKKYHQISKSKHFSQIDSRCFFTAYSGHAEEIAQRLRTDFSEPVTCVIVIAGDGTMHEVLNGLGSSSYSVAYIPAGSGNDFARGCQINGSPVKIFERIINDSRSQPYWLGTFHTNHSRDRYFINNIGFGFDAEISETVNRSVYKKMLNKVGLGKISYIIALILVLLRYKPMNLEITADGRRRKLRGCWMLTITNHPYYGGGMKIIPGAVIQPGKLPVLVIHSISKWKVLALFMTVFTGKHVRFKEVELFQAERLEIKPERKIVYQTDGQTDECSFCVMTKQTEHIKVMGI